MNFGVVLSGGVGSRMKSDIPKQYIDIGGMPVIAHTMRRIEACPSIDYVIIVLAEMWQETVEESVAQCELSKPRVYAPAGATRQHSILNGLAACAQISYKQDDKVLIHDAARPLVRPELLESCLKSMEGHDGCMPVLGLTDTTYYSDNGVSVSELLDRDKLYAGQSPESFWLKPYLTLLRSVSDSELAATRGTSEIAVRHGMDVALIPGDPGNFKITTAEDLARFRTLIEE